MPPRTATVSSVTPEEAGLLDWFAALTPGERLAELESRVEFLRAARPDDSPQLSLFDRDPDPA